jgi:hypothetical protein
MPGYQPTKPPQSSGRFSQFHFFMGAIWDMLWGGKFPLIDTDTVRWSRGPAGYAAHAAAPTAGGKGKTIDANYKVMAITQLGSSLVPPLYDLLVCREWDLTTNDFKNATDVYVAKDMEARRTITSEFYFDNGDNVTQTYTYFVATASDATYGDNFRLANDGTTSELQVMEKRYYTKGQMTTKHVSAAQASGLRNRYRSSVPA